MNKVLFGASFVLFIWLAALLWTTSLPPAKAERIEARYKGCIKYNRRWHCPVDKEP
jgi:hypothetical protein